MAPQTLSQLRARIALGASSLIGVQGYLTSWYWQRSLRAGEDVPLLAALTQRCCVNGAKFHGSFRNAQYYGVRRERLLAGEPKRHTLPGSYAGSKAELATWQRQSFPLSALPKEQPIRMTSFFHTRCMPFSSISQKGPGRLLSTTPLDLSKPFKPRTVSTLSPLPFTAAALAAQASVSTAKPDSSFGVEASEDFERRTLSKEAGFSGRSSETASLPSHAASSRNESFSKRGGKDSAPASKDSEPPWVDQPQKRMPMDPPFLYRANTAAPKGQTHLRGRDTSVRGMHMQTKAEGKEHAWGFGGPEYAAIRWFNVPIETVEALEQWEHSCQELALASKLTQFAAPGGTEEALLGSRLETESRLSRELSDSRGKLPLIAEELTWGEKVDAALKEARDRRKEAGSPQFERLLKTTDKDAEGGHRAGSISQRAEVAECGRETKGKEPATSAEGRKVETLSEGHLKFGEEDRSLRKAGGNEERVRADKRAVETALKEGQTDASIAKLENEAVEVSPEKGESTRGAQDRDLIPEGVISSAEVESAAQQRVPSALKMEEAGDLKRDDARQSQEVLEKDKGAQYQTAVESSIGELEGVQAGVRGEALKQQHLREKKQKDEDRGIERKHGTEELSTYEKRPKIAGGACSAAVRRGERDRPNDAESQKTRVEGRVVLQRSKEDRRSIWDQQKQDGGRRAPSVSKSPLVAEEKVGGQGGTLFGRVDPMASGEIVVRRLSWAELIAPTSEFGLSANGVSSLSESPEAEPFVQGRPQKLSWAELIAPEVADAERSPPARRLSWAELMQPAETEEQPAAVDGFQKTTRAIDDLRAEEETPQVEEAREKRVGSLESKRKRQGLLGDQDQRADYRVKTAAGVEKGRQLPTVDAIQETTKAVDGPRSVGKRPQVIVSSKETPKAGAEVLTAPKKREIRLQNPAHGKESGLRTKEKAQQQDAVWEEWRKGKNETRDELVAKLTTAASLGEVQRCMDAYSDDVRPKDALQIVQALREKGQLLPAYHFFTWANAQPALAANRFLLAQALPIAAQIGRLAEFEELLFDDLSAFRKPTTDASPESSILHEEGASFEERAVEGVARDANELKDCPNVVEARVVESDKAPLLAETFLCNTLLEAYIEQGRWQEALGVFDRMQAPRGVSEQQAFGGWSDKEIALRDYREEGAEMEAEKTERLEEHDLGEGQIIREDYGWLEQTFQAWMHHDVKRRRGLRDWKDGLHLELPRRMMPLDVLGSRDVFSFNLAMRACLKGNLELAHVWALREELEREGLVPDCASYNLSIAACCKLLEGSAHFNVRARAEDALLLIEEMQARGLSPNVHTYTATIDAWAQANTAVARALGRAESSVMVSVFERMLHEGGTPNVVTYGALVGGFAKMGALEDAELAVEDMLVAGILPNQGVINAFLAGCELAGEFGRARDWVQRLRDRGLPCSLETQTRLLSVRVNTGGARAVVDACEKLGSSYIKALRKQRSEIMGAETALKQRQSEEPPTEPLKGVSAAHVAVDADGHIDSESVRSDDVALYKILIQALVKAGKVEGVAPVLLEMAQRQCAPDLVTYNVVLDACSRSTDWEITDQIVEALGNLAAQVEAEGGVGTAGRTQTGSSSGEQETLDSNNGVANPTWHAANLELPPAFLAATSELLATQISDDDVKKRAQSLMSILRARGEPPKNVLAFFSSLCDALWSFGWEKRISLVAGNLLGPGFQRGFKDRRPLSSATDREWSLDVRRLGKGAGQAILMLWLRRAREDFLAGERPPVKLAIVTGYGGRKWGRGELNEVVGELLRSMGAPFWVTHRNPGRFTANGYDVCEWLIEEGMEAKLALSDGTSEPEEQAAEAY